MAKRKPVKVTLAEIEAARKLLRRHFYPRMVDAICGLAASRVRAIRRSSTGAKREQR